MKTPLTVEQIREAEMPVSDGYFEDADGNEVARTQFEYIRDHLGYRIELQKAQFPKSVTRGAAFAVDVELINRGFSVMHNPRRVFLTLVDAAGNVVHVQQSKANPRTWQPFAPGDTEYTPLTHTVDATIQLPQNVGTGSYWLGLWMPDAADSIQKDARYAIRAANRDVPWWTSPSGQYGINVLGEITVDPVQ